MPKDPKSTVSPAAAPRTRTAARLPPLLAAFVASQPEEAAARNRMREQKAALVRGVASIPEMRDAIQRVARTLPTIEAVPRIHALGPAAFRARAEIGLPFVVTGLVDRWPLAGLTQQTLRERFSDLRVRARVGDYVNTAFAPDRAMQDMSMGEYLDLIASCTHPLPPYLGNLELRDLNSLCHWPAYFKKMGPPRFWIGPAGTVTPLHCDYDDNIFAQIWGTKRVFLVPPHHDAFLYTRAANAILYGSPFDPEAPDFEQFPLARQASLIECVVSPGELLYVPAGWYHQVRSLTFSVSANRWARAMPLALQSEMSGAQPV